MHIPDGYLSPQTDAVLGIASAITAAGAAYQTARTIKDKYIPLISMGAAFSFIIMMFNIPIPDGTTAHAVGGTLLSILLGPWAAMVGVSIALVLQALFFGDGGILALGANIFNMAVILPFVSYGIYHMVAGRNSVSFKRQWIGAVLAGYIGLTISALCAGIELGLQPLLFHTENGTPLYSPYGLNVAVPAMLFAHLTIAAPVEGVVTALVLKYLQRTNPAMLHLRKRQEEGIQPFSFKKLILGLSIIAVLSPLGILATGTAWGEWGDEELQAKLGFLPSGLQSLSNFWKHALFKDYTLSGLDQTFWQQALGYLISAFAGLAIIGIVAIIIQRVMRKGET